MISSLQALLARTILRLSQKQVGEQLGMAHTTLSNIENGISDPPASRLQELQEFYERAGIEFLAGDGIRRRADNQISILEGASGFIEFLKDVHQVVPARPDVVVNNVDERLFLHWEGDFNTIHQTRMKEAGASSRIIVEEGDDHPIASEYAEYRWAPKELFSTISYYVYGDRTAPIDFQKNNVFVYLIRRQAIADFFRNEFQKVWDLSRVPLE